MDEFEIGQVWTSRPSDTCPPLLCIIGKIDTDLTAPADANRGILSLMIAPHPDTRAAGWKPINHLPLSEKAFRDSDLTLVRTGVATGDAFDKGYRHWKTE